MQYDKVKSAPQLSGTLNAKRFLCRPNTHIPMTICEFHCQNRPVALGYRPTFADNVRENSRSPLPAAAHTVALLLIVILVFVRASEIHAMVRHARRLRPADHRKSLCAQRSCSGRGTASMDGMVWYPHFDSTGGNNEEKLNKHIDGVFFLFICLWSL